MSEFRFRHQCNEEEKECIGEETIKITNFKQVTICLDDKTRIIYRLGVDRFAIEDLHKDTNDIDDYSGEIEGPQAISIIDTMIRSYKARGATFIWKGIHYELSNGRVPEDASRTVDYVDDEMHRKQKKAKEEGRIEEIMALLEINERANVYHDKTTTLSIDRKGFIHVFQVGNKNARYKTNFDKTYTVSDYGLTDTNEVWCDVNDLVDKLMKKYYKRIGIKYIMLDLLRIMMKVSLKIRG